MKKLILSSTLLFSVLFSQAQKIVPCVTDELYLESVVQHPELKLEEERVNAIARLPIMQKALTIKYIPVVFHVIHKYGLENISQTQINDAIRILNEDYRRTVGTNGASSTDPLATDMQIEFRLAQFDPNGLPTNGVNRIYNINTDNARDQQKALSYWDAKKYFNIWVVNSIKNTTGSAGTILGFAQFPFQLNSQPTTDGVMALYSQIGIIETAEIAQAGRTLTHEAGHWVGLYHPFQNACSGASSSNCASQGDWVCDTPPVLDANYGCVNSRNSCTNDFPDLPDLVKDYMDYADGNCMNLFTAGQKARVDPIMTSTRATIFSETNLSAAGLNADGTYKTLTASATKAPYQYNFDAATLTGSGWSLENYTCPGDSGWQLNTTIGAAGNGCLSAMNLKTNRTNVRNAFCSPSIDISTVYNPTLSFMVAYAKRTTASADKLKVYISNSYGRSEILIKTFSSTDMQTGAVSTASFVPANSEWQKLTLDLSAYKTYTNCKIRFELLSLKGNNIYFDGFTITNPVGISEALKQALNFSVFPNPSSEFSILSFENTKVSNIEFTLIDLQGKIVEGIASQNFDAGKHEVKMDLKGLKPGIYLLEVKTENGVFAHKVIIE